jgi:hypothetical protein
LDQEEQKRAEAFLTLYRMFEGLLEWNGETYHIDQSGYLWKGELF